MKNPTVTFIPKRYDAHAQPWIPFGAPNKAEYERWSPEVCGICCLKMAGDALGTTQQLSVYEVAMETLQKGGFKFNPDGSIEGVFHKPLLEVARSHGLDGTIERDFSIDRIRTVLEQGGMAILSIDKAKVSPTLQGGHLVLVWHYDDSNRSFLIHDSEKLLSETGEGVAMHEAGLKKISKNRGISVFTRKNHSWIRGMLTAFRVLLAVNRRCRTEFGRINDPA